MLPCASQEFELQIAKYEQIPWSRFANVRGSSKASPEKQKSASGFKRLFAGTTGKPGNFEMVALLTDTDSGSFFPRHRHDFDQVRYTIAGNPEWTPGHPAPAGTVIYTAAGTYYGPYERHKGDEQLHVQFESANGAPFIDYDAQVDAQAELAKKGTFEKGIYTWTDERGQVCHVDAHQAVIEQILGYPQEFPAPRFATQIDLHTQNFSWIDIGPGVCVKELAKFTEQGVRLAMLTLHGGAEHRLESPAQRTLVFVTEGSGTAGGQDIVKRDGVMLDKGDAAVFATRGTLELLLLGLPNPI
jgi:hypothetical protein